jgi:DNA-binding transcriptional LysR family regulator
MSAQMQNLRHLRVFQAVVELGNFSRAAERLHTSQAGVSHAIHDLEELLGTRLFHRTTRRVELTEAGKVFAAGALPGLGEIERAADAVRDLGQLKTGLVRIGAPPLLAATVLPRLINQVEQEYPNLKIRIDDVPMDVITTQVRNGIFDLGVGSFRSNDDGIEIMRVLKDCLMAFTLPDHELRHHAEVSWSMIHAEKIVALTRESSIRLLTEIGFEQAGIPFRPALEVHQTSTALSLVENGVGLAILPTYAIAAINGRKIIARPLVDPIVSRDVNIVTARERDISPACAAVRVTLRRLLREMVPEVG